MSRYLILFILGIDVLILMLQTTTLSISAREADILYGSFSLLQAIENSSLGIFGNTDFALRLPMIVFHVLSIVLLYKISKKYVDDLRNRVWLIVVFILLPGVLSSALLIDTAGIIIFSLLLFIYIYERFSLAHTYPLLFVFSVIDGMFLYLFISLFFYAFYIKNKTFLATNIVLVGVSVYLYGLDTGGHPEGYLLDALGLYSAIFTPVIFLYIFYVLYKRFLSKELNILWFIATVPLLVSLLLSFRQKLDIEDFAPYLIVALPLAAQTFYASYRVRLKMFRKRYKLIFISSSIFLLVNFVIVLFNRELYLVIENPKKHFARKMHVAKELASALQARGITCINANESMSKRLHFYGIEKCQDSFLVEQQLNAILTQNTVTISYKYRPIYKAIVTNINIDKPI